MQSDENTSDAHQVESAAKKDSEKARDEAEDLRARQKNLILLAEARQESDREPQRQSDYHRPKDEHLRMTCRTVLSGFFLDAVICIFTLVNSSVATNVVTRQDFRKYATPAAFP